MRKSIQPSNLNILSYTALLLAVTALLLTGMAGRHRLSDNWANLQIVSAILRGKEAQLTDGSFYLRGVAAFQHEQYSESVMWLQKANAQRSNTLVRWHLAQALNRNGKWHIALDLLDTQVPVEREIHSVILLELFEDISALSPPEQAEWHQRIRQEYPDLILPYANYLLDTHHFLQARKWAKLSPDYTQSANAQMIIGWSYFYINSFAEAEVAFRSAYRLSPSGITAFAYGRTLLYESKLREAIPFLEEAVQVESSSSALAWYLSELGVAYARVGRCAEAVTAFEQALEYDPRIENVERITKAQTRSVGACEINMRP